MGQIRLKNKERKRHSNHHDDPRNSKKQIVVRRAHSQLQAQKPKQQQQNQRPKVPFTKLDNVLLVGEGDFSFALSLKRNHAVRSITATGFDSMHEVGRKYGVAVIGERIEELSGLNRMEKGTEEGEEVWEGLSPSPVAHRESHGEENRVVGDVKTRSQTRSQTWTEVTVHHGIDATKLSTAHKKLLRRCAPFTKIVFNFPHVGGLSTDVNRQVRANQELLVGFFNAAKGLLVSEANPMKVYGDGVHHGHWDVTEEERLEGQEEVNGGEGLEKTRELASVRGQILVTLFEGEPYTLWNVRDLARHCGLMVVESFKFPWEAYPSYQHARTIGNITTGKDKSAEGTRKGAWRGEERKARTFMLEVKDPDGEMGHVSNSGTGGNTTPRGSRGKKRKTDTDEESD